MTTLLFQFLRRAHYLKYKLGKENEFSWLITPYLFFKEELDSAQKRTNRDLLRCM